MEAKRQRRATRFDVAAALAARALPDALTPLIEQARLDATMIATRARGRSPAPLVEKAAKPIPLSEVDLLSVLPRRLSERLDTVRRDARMLTGRLIFGKNPSPLIERPQRSPGDLVSLPRRAPNMTRPVKVTQVVHETDDAVSIYLTEADGSPLEFRPGQFLSVDVVIDGERFRRAYSLASPCIDGAARHITVKRIANGRVSNHLNDTVRAGAELAVLGPSGSFSVEPRAVNERHLIMIAGGSGITPIMSILETVLRLEPRSRVTLIYGNRSLADIIFRERLDSLHREYDERLVVDHVLEHAPEPWSGGRGLLTAEVLEARLRALGIDDDGISRYFLCGPTPMMAAAHDVLQARGVSVGRIAEEKFTRPEARHGVHGSDQTELVIVSKGGSDHGIQVEPGQSILEAGLAAGIEMPFSCAMGGCGACRVRLLEGDVQMAEPNCLSESERAQSYVLTCVGRPRTQSRILVEAS